LNENKTPMDDWARSELDRVVKEVLNAGIFQGARVEARVAWTLPGAVLIGQIRENIDKSGFRWVVAGPDVPLDHVQGDVAATPRDALRHFCLKWQLGAEKVHEASQNDPDTGEHYRAKAEQLQKQAEDLYEIVESDQFWNQ
jgi:hypothetical protein